MLTSERHAKILNLLKKHRAVTTSEIVEKFNVSPETVRRDFMALEKAGNLCRVHGGAVSVGNMKEFNPFEKRITENDRQKEQLSLIAAEYIEDGDIIAIDAGSTAVYFANAIKETNSKLTVVTHSLDVLNILSKQDGVEVILCGGQYMKGENCCYGDLVCDALNNLRVNKAFIFPLSISLGFGLGENSPELARVQKKMIAMAKDVYLLADSSKFEKTALYKTGDVRSEYVYITDSDIDSEISSLYQENGFNIITERENGK